MDLLRQVRRGRLTRVIVPLLAAAAIPATASAVTTSSTTDVTYAAVNSCTGEEVTFTGKKHETTGANVNLNGTITITHELDMRQAVGTTPAGVKYTTTDKSMEHMVVDVDLAPTTTTVHHRLRYTRQGESAVGGDDDFLMYIRIHITVNANGDATASPGDFDTTCS
jgi:hypothetical protein